jgi:hypothetical protein
MTAIADPERQLDGATRPRYLTSVDVRAAVRIAGIFNAILGVAFMLTGWLVIAVAAQRGFLDQINSVTSDLSTGHPMRFSAVRLCLVWAVIVAGWAIAMTVVAALATLIFNHVLQIFGGVELDLRANAPERVDVEATLRGVVESVRSKLQARAPSSPRRA